MGLPVGAGQVELIRWLSSGGGFLTRAGRATDAGVNFMGNIGIMRLERMPSRRATLDLLDRKLNDGYVYCAYYWNNARGGRQGHAVVIYGVEHGTVYFSDPAPGRGLVKAAASFFSRESLVVALGTSLLVGLRRNLDQAFSGLLSSRSH